VRKVFPHEVRNIVSYKAHRNADAEGKASYPLPLEGQPASLPRLLGGKAPDNEDDPRPSPLPNNTWQEGTYFWTSTSMPATLEKLRMMNLDLEKQGHVQTMQSQRAEVWQDYDDRVKQGTSRRDLAARYGKQAKGPVMPVPPLVSEAERAKSMLLRIPPEWPSLSERIGKLLAPSKHALAIFRESLMSGEQRDFAFRVRDKALTGEPWDLASKTITKAYERWKSREPADEDDSKKGST